MSIKVIVTKCPTRQELIDTIGNVYSATKTHRPIDEYQLSQEEKEKLYKQYFSFDNPLLEYNEFEFHIYGASRDFLAHISRENFIRMWVGSHRVAPDGYNFVENEEYYVPSHLEHDRDFIKEKLGEIEDIMNEAVNRPGWRTDDVKTFLPHGITIPITVSTTWRGLLSMCRRRACFQVQTFWFEVIQGLASHVRDNVDPWLADKMVRPFCMDRGSCHVKMEHYARHVKWPEGHPQAGQYKDPLEICPIYINLENEGPEHKEELKKIAKEKNGDSPQLKVFRELGRSMNIPVKEVN